MIPLFDKALGAGILVVIVMIFILNRLTRVPWRDELPWVPWCDELFDGREYVRSGYHERVVEMNREFRAERDRQINMLLYLPEVKREERRAVSRLEYLDEVETLEAEAIAKLQKSYQSGRNGDPVP